MFVVPSFLGLPLKPITFISALLSVIQHVAFELTLFVEIAASIISACSISAIIIVIAGAGGIVCTALLLSMLHSFD
jgi:hypothetical protein